MPGSGRDRVTDGSCERRQFSFRQVHAERNDVKKLSTIAIGTLRSTPCYVSKGYSFSLIGQVLCERCIAS